MKIIIPILAALLLSLPAQANEPRMKDGVYTPGNSLMQKLSKSPAPDKAAQSSDDDAQPEIKTGDKAEIGRLQNYLNSIKTMRADFMQTMSDGNTLNGKVAISRPGKMRLEYDPPNENLMVADGAFMHVWDGQAKTGSSIPLGSSLADIILRDDLKLGGDIQVTELKKYPAALQMTLVQTDNPAAGSITLEFEDKPLKLKNWRIMDGQGVETRVAIYNQQMDVSIPSSTFFYRDPNMHGGHIN
ncbi:MAG: outer membrane lipoprotein carrier protein LolA [Alphaproteobacteria bacterium]|nr:outer membrane lipoprotein carrier protein LolA [Alphaproteobacteria bacterium]